jgi:hypothetical protein
MMFRLRIGDQDAFLGVIEDAGGELQPFLAAAQGLVADPDRPRAPPAGWRSIRRRNR